MTYEEAFEKAKNIYSDCNDGAKMDVIDYITSTLMDTDERIRLLEQLHEETMRIKNELAKENQELREYIIKLQTSVSKI